MEIDRKAVVTSSLSAVAHFHQYFTYLSSSGALQFPFFSSTCTAWGVCNHQGSSEGDGPGGGGVLPYMCYIGMCGPKGYGFSANLVINWVSILAILPLLASSRKEEFLQLS